LSRRHLTFASGREVLAATIDEAEGHTGLLIVSGGNEVRTGAFSGQAQMAARIAAAGFPVFRFDRSGVGDSTGENRGFRGSGADILAALATFRREMPNVQRVVGFGNCDAASALMLLRGDMCDALILSNPWTFEDDDGEEVLPPAEAIRARYAKKLRSPTEVFRLLKGEVSLSRLSKGLKALLRPYTEPTSLAQAMATGLDAATKPYVILIAGNDRTGQAFAAQWAGTNGSIHRCEGASHAYVEPFAREWLEQHVLAMMRG
jgi:exosortase A-associated hydrolase 1